MEQPVFSFLSKNCSSNPLAIDRLFVSAFLQANDMVVCNNNFIKSYVISDDSEKQVLASFMEVIRNTYIPFSIERLVELYEFVISPADKVVNGAVYTPEVIRNFITEEVFNDNIDNINEFKIGDISCGCGGFLYTAAVKFKDITQLSYQEIFRNNIIGIDIQSYSITRTKIILTLLAIIEGEDIEELVFNLFVGDTLSFDFTQQIPNFNGFDVIVGNPPYVCSRHLTKDTKEKLLNWTVCSSGHPDLYIPFFQIGIENLKDNGVLGYITMNSFFKSLNGRALREYFHLQRLDFKIIDFGSEQIFRSKNTYTCICIIRRIWSEFISFSRMGSNALYSEIRPIPTNVNYADLDHYKGWNLQDSSIIAKIEMTGIPLGQLYKTRHGIATLKNSVYIFKPLQEDSKYYYMLVEKTSYPIEKEICRSIVNSNKLNGSGRFEEIIEKVIFPYSNSDTPKPISEEEFVRLYPMAYKYLKKCKPVLDERDKGTGKYEKWYCFGRTQSLERMKHKLFFPKIANRSPLCVINSDDNMLFYNGQAIIGRNIEELLLIKKIMETRLFWYYIETSSKPYSSNYYSLNGNYIKNFGIYNFSEEEKNYIINEVDIHKLNTYIESKYGVELSKEIFSNK